MKKSELGQTLIEYTLLVAFVGVAGSALLITTGASIKPIWVSANTHLSLPAAAGAHGRQRQRWRGNGGSFKVKVDLFKNGELQLILVPEDAIERQWLDQMQLRADRGWKLRMRQCSIADGSAAIAIAISPDD